MTEQQKKADELVKKMYKVHSNSASQITLYFAKQCALIAVDEVISACEYNFVESYNTDWWQEVKNEINKL